MILSSLIGLENTMLRLYIMRHAKSSWAVPGARDFDRELNERGLSDLEKMSRLITENNYIPEQVLCSSSQRTRQTLDGISGAFTPQPAVTYTQKLYSSGYDDYIELIRATEHQGSLMVIGHNPMCGTLAANLAGKGNDEALSKIAYKYPTSALSIIDFECESWEDIAKGEGILIDSHFPSEL